MYVLLTYSTILDEVFKYAAFCHEMLQENTKKTRENTIQQLRKYVCYVYSQSYINILASAIY